MNKKSTTLGYAKNQKLKEHRLFALKEEILKIQWERYQKHVILSRAHIEKLVALYVCDEITSIYLMKEGCANTNYKINFKKHMPVVLRIYTRDSSAMGREADIYCLVQEHVPVPIIKALDNSKSNINYVFAIYSYIPGILMRELILAGEEKIIRECCLDAAQYLVSLSKIKFAQQGFFEEKLKVKFFTNNYINYFIAQLDDRNVRRELDKKTINKLLNILELNNKYLPDIREANLTHGDYDPANIKVAKINNQWRVVGILDWEFAFAGNSYFDIGQMLRFSHKLPKYYESSFLTGLKQYGMNIPDDWQKYSRIIDLLSLLQLIRFNSQHTRPKLNSDVAKLINFTIDYFEKNM